MILVAMLKLLLTRDFSLFSTGLLRSVCSCSSIVPATKSNKKSARLNVSPAPGSVPKYDVHVLLRLPFVKGELARKKKNISLVYGKRCKGTIRSVVCGSGRTFGGCRWPAVVEKEPAFVEVFSNLSSFLGGQVTGENEVKFKVTAYEPVDGGPELRGDECGMMLFPHGGPSLICSR